MGFYRHLRCNFQKLLSITACKIGDRSNDTLTPENFIGELRDVTHVDPPANHNSAFAQVAQGEWDEASEVATILDMRLPAKLYQPGDSIAVAISPIYEREGDLDEHYVPTVRLLDPSGNELADAHKHMTTLQSVELKLVIPENAPAGRYTVEYSLAPHRDGAEPIMVADRSLYVLHDLKQRLAALEKKLDAVTSQGFAKNGLRYQIATDTVAWHLGAYSRGLKEDVPGAYTNHPIFMTMAVAAAGMVIDRMDFTNELSLAESLADDLLSGRDPLRERKGDMRLAYRSPADGELVPFRVFVPSAYDPDETWPLAIGLHGAGGDENSFMDRYQGLFKSNAEKRGYIVASANGRGPYGGYRGNSGQDVTDVLDILQEIYPVDITRTYLTGHSMGGGGTVSIGFAHPERFAALAPIAGFGSPQQLQKAVDMPLFIGQGDQDALVPVESARALYQAAKDLDMPHVKYVERAGVEHLTIVDHVMDEVFDWFDAHRK